MSQDTICAIATPPGFGGVSILRISGDKSRDIASKIVQHSLTPRKAHYCEFKQTSGELLDQGIALFFPKPHSFTGEDVLELQGHGGPVVMDLLLKEVLSLGARQANPGEFSERAFLNDKLDLAQAEAIADLIHASSTQAAKNALNSLSGGFSNKIDALLEQLIQLRIYVESAIDFPEEEIDFLSDGKIAQDLIQILALTDEILHQAKQGLILKEGMKVVIAGRPNAGKSSLLNRLAQKDVAIVTNIAGTTRDVLREHIHIDGMPLHIIDTAGLRESPDEVEKLGIERAWTEIEQADRILLLIDSTDPKQHEIEKQWPEFFTNPIFANKLTVVFNKIDVSHFVIPNPRRDYHQVCLSAKDGTGLSHLTDHLKQVMGLSNTVEGNFSARRRHISSIKKAKAAIENGQIQLEEFAAGELLAEDLRLAQEYLGEITGKFSSDDLLGEIFSSFCIGK